MVLPEIHSHQPIGVSDARRKLGDYVTAAARHHPVSFANREHLGMLVGVRDLGERLLAPYEFHPEMCSEDGGISIWLPELELYGSGESLEEAMRDLSEEVRDYVSRYLGEIELYLNSPNRSRHFPYVLRAHALDLLGQMESELFRPQQVDA